MLAARVTETARQHRNLSASNSGDSALPTPDGTSYNAIAEACSIAWRSDLRLGHMHTHLDPFGHALNCVRGAVSAGCKLLRGIEAALGIPAELGVKAGLEMSTAAILGESAPSASTLDMLSSDGSPASLSARLVAVLWQEEGDFEGSVSGKPNATAVLGRCNYEFRQVALQHAKAL